MHKLVFVVDHVSVDAPLYATVDEFAVSVTVGAGAGCTIMVTELLALPPVPMHDKVYVAVVVSAVRVCELAIALLPIHALPTGPLAVQDDALTTDHVKLLEPL